MTSIGQMDQRITLQTRVSTPDGAGGVKVTWRDFALDPCPWAHVLAKAGREEIREGRPTAVFTVLFTIWNRSDVTEADRILWDGVAYNIRGIRREGTRRAQLVIEAERGVAT